MTKSYWALAAGVSALALSTAAFADSNEAYTSQFGTSGEITVTQTGSNNQAGLSASTPLSQDGSGNSLIVNQSGTYNRVGKADAPLVSGSRPSTSATTDTTVLFSSTQNGQNNTLDLNQSNNSNWISYSQTGNNNGNINAGAFNGTTGAGSFENPNYGNASVNRSSNPKWNYVNQNGRFGDIAIKQTSGSQATAGSGIIANQGGVNNGINLTQTTNFSGSNLAYFDQRNASYAAAVVNQEHNYSGTTDPNLVDIRQSGTGSGIWAQQTGKGLDLFAVQSGRVFAETNQALGANNSSIVLRQTGTGVNDSERNYVYAYQGGTGPGQLYGYNRLTVDQDGKNNDVFSNQLRSDTAIFAQNSNANTINSIQGGQSYANVAQYGGDGNSTTNTQAGNGRNSLTATQNGTNNIVLNSQTNTTSMVNTVSILQVGNSLKADSTQNGYFLTATVDQTGTSNTYTGNQAGFSNDAKVYQGASSNVANVVQGGSSNQTTIRQNRS